MLQWKGNWKHARWMAGEGDIDLLVDRGAEAQFRNVLEALGFRRADAPVERRLPGIESHFGLDPVTGRLIHLHVYYRLLLGSYWHVMYRLPIEAPLLQSAMQGNVFLVPSAEFELLTFVVRMVQRLSPLDVLRPRPPRWLTSIQPELDALLRKADQGRLGEIVAAHIPVLDVAFIETCIAALRPDCSRGARAVLPWRLRRRLRAHARRPTVRQGLLRWARNLAERVGTGRGGSRNKVAHGGTVVAIVGSDGAGKTTCTRELAAWLSQGFAVMTAHLGHPPRSLLTLAVGALLRLGQTMGVSAASDEARRRAPGYLAALRALCSARDRHRLYVRARRFAFGGGIALCERYPVALTPEFAGPRLDAFAGPLRRTRLGRWLLAAEASYYRRILSPDLLVVLRIDPEIAVRRKTDEPEEYVRRRGHIVWAADWSATGAHVVDAGGPFDDVLARLKAVIWREL